MPTCPECGSSDIKNEVCEDCGIILEDETDIATSDSGTDVSPSGLSSEESHNQIDDMDHALVKHTRWTYSVSIEDGDIIIDEEPLSASVALGSGAEPFEYGEYFQCSCGERFHREQPAKEHIISNKN